MPRIGSDKIVTASPANYFTGPYTSNTLILLYTISPYIMLYYSC